MDEVVRYWCGYLSGGARCKWFAYGPADATATPSSLAPVKSRMVYLSGAGLPRLCWEKMQLNGCSSSSSSAVDAHCDVTDFMDADFDVTYFCCLLSVLCWNGRCNVEWGFSISVCCLLWACSEWTTWRNEDVCWNWICLVSNSLSVALWSVDQQQMEHWLYVCSDGDMWGWV